MRTVIPLAAALLLAAPSLALAAKPPAGAPAASPPLAASPAPPPLPTPPRVFALAGYTEPMIPPTSCKNINASQTKCLIPAMTAGRYLASVTGASTASAADAAQEIVVLAGDQSCRIPFKPNAKTPWAIGVKHVFHAGCVFAILTDAPLVVTAAYLDQGATKDPGGPTLTLVPQPWSGALNAVPVSFPEVAAPK